MSKERTTGKGMVDGLSGAIVDGYYRIELPHHSAPEEVGKLLEHLKECAGRRALKLPEGPARQGILHWLGK